MIYANAGTGSKLSISSDNEEIKNTIENAAKKVLDNTEVLRKNILNWVHNSSSSLPEAETNNQNIKVDGNTSFIYVSSTNGNGITIEIHGLAGYRYNIDYSNDSKDEYEYIVLPGWTADDNTSVSITAADDGSVLAYVF